MGDLQTTAAGRMPRRPVLFRMPRRQAASRAAAVAAAGPPVPAAGRKKKRMAVARLGGKRRLFGAIRRLRMRWLAALYRRSLRRLRACYARALRDLLEGAAVVSTLRAQAGADCSFGTAFAPVVTTVGF
ncbi:hypothetical protein ACP4OV_000393 [Aristida adscensionis]